MYDLDQLDAARARFAELSTAPEPGLANLAIAFVNKLRDVDRSAGWAAVEPLLTADFVGEDRRAFAQVRKSGPEFFRPFFDLAGIEIESRSEWLATRGERLVLHRTSVEVRDGMGGLSMAEVLVIDEVDTEGRAVAEIYFDVEDLDAAYAELDARYAAGEVHADAPSDASATRALDELYRVCLARDWNGLRDVFAVGGVYEDRRMLVRASGDVEQLVASAQFVQSNPGVQFDIDPVARYGDRVALVRRRLHDGSNEVELLDMVDVDHEGRIDRVHAFRLDRYRRRGRRGSRPIPVRRRSSVPTCP